VTEENWEESKNQSKKQKIQTKHIKKNRVKNFKTNFCETPLRCGLCIYARVNHEFHVFFPIFECVVITIFSAWLEDFRHSGILKEKFITLKNLKRIQQPEAEK
jgi:hypothetical protein